MRTSKYLTAAVMTSLTGTGLAAISPLVSGTPVGFAASVTGGGTAAAVTPTTIAQLTSYLTDSSPRVIVISGTFDFSGSEGTTTLAACNIYSCNPSNAGQAMLNTLGGCPSGTTYNVNVDTAAYKALWIKSNKTLIGKNGATIRGKGFRMSGVENIIIQNIKIDNLNPKYVWGGDAIALTDTNLIWIDHVTTSNLGRQHYSFGQGPNKAVTISNSFISGSTSYSSTCDGRSYWGMELVGTGDFITFYRNWVYKTSGRGPALSGNTLFHAVNNVWSSSGGHLLEGTDSGKGLYEGNYFIDTPTIVASGFVGKLFSSVSNLAACSTYLGRSCVANFLGSGAGAFSKTDTSFFSSFSGKSIAPVAAATSIANSVINGAGNTL